MSYIVGFIDISGTAILPPSVGVAGTPGDWKKKNKQSMVTGSLDLMRRRQRNNYDRLITGGILRSEVGESPDRSLSGNFGIVSGSSNYANQFATVPAWTQHQIGKHHAFVAPALSASGEQHLAGRLNTFFNGTEALERTAVPASRSLYYSKAQRMVYKIYKLSASIDLPVNPITLEQYPFTGEITAPRSIFVTASGSYRANSYFNPSVFEIDIPDYGRIRDLRVWVEFIHDVRSGTGSIGTVSPLPYQGIGNVQVAIRSPNVTFKSGHPLWNDPKAANFGLRGSLVNLTGSSNQFGDDRYHKIPSLLDSAYLLWAGHNVDRDDLSVTLSEPNSNYVSWDNDIDMRTIFWDGSSQFNPRHLDTLLPNAVEASPGQLDGSVLNLTGALSGGAPNNAAFTIAAAACGFLAPAASGTNAPWILDPRLQSGSIRHSDFITSVIGSSPPSRWLTGPGGTAAAGEFPTTGSNLGPMTIKPVYPILDDVFVEKKTDEAVGNPNYAKFGLPPFHPKLIGFRPGLRGTEIHGKWQLLIGVGTVSGSANFPFDPVNGMVAHARAGIWFRQFRLEFIIDQGGEPADFYPSKGLRFKRPSYVPTRDGKRRVQIMSGAASWDLGIDYVLTRTDPAYGRFIGIMDATGSSADFAIFTRLTGVLADQLAVSSSLPSPSGTAHTLYSYLHNEFGTPYIPISSGSGIAPAFQFFERLDPLKGKTLISEVIQPKPIIPAANTARAAISRLGTLQTRQARLNLSITKALKPKT